jgi:two-component system sensor histidine kinase/response regulator
LARDTIAALCRAVGWQADTVAGGAQAVTQVQASAARGLAYDAVFVDWLMPEIDGWETCARIRKLDLPDGPPLVVMVTAQRREKLDARSAREPRVLDGFLVKPVTGTMLRQALQRARTGGADVAPADPPAATLPLAGLRLLLAEDNEVNQQIALELLSRRGAQVDVVGDGRAALERIASGPRYDAILMDVQMPVLDGLSATRQLRLRADAQTLPVIAMTANAMDSDRDACLAAGMNAHVGKPFVMEDVVATILRHTGRAHEPFSHETPAPAERRPFDRGAALEQLAGDEELLQHVLPVFRDNLRAAARQLQSASAVPASELERLVHTLKGMAANLGAATLAQAAADAESRLASGESDTGASLDEVLKQTEAVLAVIDGWHAD